MLTVVGVMGSGRDPGPEVIASAELLGTLIAQRGWVLLNGGRACGVMDASARGAAAAGGLVVNLVNVLSSDVVIAMPGGAGTLSEVALALKAERTVICLGFDPGPAVAEYRGVQLLEAATPEEAVALASTALALGTRET